MSHGRGHPLKDQKGNIRLTFVKWFVALPAPQNRLRVSCEHFNLDRTLLEEIAMVSWDI